MIKVRGLRKNYGSVKAVDGIDFEIKPGSVTGLLGPNACGKTTLLKSVLGLVIPNSGSIEVDGHSILENSNYKKKIGYMPQSPNFPSNLKVSELFCMLEDIRQEKAVLKAELVSFFDIQDSLERMFGVLSGGTMQKVAAVAAFMFDPKILFLDEPTVGLDPVAAVRLKDLIKKTVSKGKTILLVTHIMNEMEEIAEEMLFMLEGKILFHGSVEKMLKESDCTHLDQAVVKMIGKSK